MPSAARFSRTALALAVAAAFGLGAIVADHHGATATADAATPTLATAAAPVVVPVAQPGAGTTSALPNFADLVARHGAAVVEVSTEKLARKTAAHEGGAPDLSQLPPWLRNMPGLQGGEPDQGPMRGLGSGFVVDPSGIILTNAHVVDGADEVKVKFVDQREYTAKVLGVDKATDIAVLKVDLKNLQVVRIGDPAKARVGEWVVAIGAPFGLENTVTAGIVSAKSRSLPGDSIVPFIQTDAAVNPGNSGGPLFNLDGEVIGINSQIYSRSGGFQGLSFAIPIDVAMSVESQIVQHGKASHGKLGVTIQEVTQELADNFGLKQPGGALVGTVEKDGPGAKAGLQPGDVITAFNGRPILRSAELPPLVASLPPGSPVNLTIWRDGKAQQISATTVERETEKVASADDSATDQGKLGVAVRPLTAEEKQEVQLDYGLVVEDVGGAAQRAGVQQGDVILSVNRTPVKSAAQLKDLIGKSGKIVALLVQRDDARIFIPVKIG